MELGRTAVRGPDHFRRHELDHTFDLFLRDWNVFLKIGSFECINICRTRVHYDNFNLSHVSSVMYRRLSSLRMSALVASNHRRLDSLRYAPQTRQFTVH